MNIPLAKQRAIRERPRYRRAAMALKFVSIVYMSILGSMMFWETNLVFPSAGPDRGNWNHPGIELEEVDFESIDGTRLHGFYFPKPGASTTLLFCHGNAENIAMLAGEMNDLRERLQANVFIFDYRGYGKSEGKPFERGIFEDAEAASLWLAAKTGRAQNDFFLLGRSLGGSAAIHLASKNGARGLMLDRTFSSAVDVAASRYWWLPVRFVMRNQFLSHAKLPLYRGPLLQMHGDVDEIIPLWSAQRLFERSPSANKKFQMIEGLYHNDPCPDAFLLTLQGFMESL